MNLKDIENIKIIWSENAWLYNLLGEDENGDINKILSPEKADEVIKEAAQHRDSFPYDKTRIEVTLKTGEKWCTKYYLNGDTKGLIYLIKGDL